MPSTTRCVERSMTRPAPLALILAAAVALTLPAASSAQEDWRRELLQLINAERTRAGVPPLQLSPALNQAAQRHAQQVAERGTLRLPGNSSEAMRREIQEAGYQPQEWTESLQMTGRPPAELLGEWARNDRDTWDKLLDPNVRDLGIGLARLQRLPLYSFLYAVPLADAFQRETAHLRNLAAVRKEMLDRVNAVGRREGLRPMRSDKTLDATAQGHGEDMLRRAFFDHRNPDGQLVRERAVEAGYKWTKIGENIAEGQLSVEEVVDTWLKSPGHRRNILDPDFQELGVGLVLGQSRGRWRILWVQNFGTPRRPG